MQLQATVIYVYIDPSASLQKKKKHPTFRIIDKSFTDVVFQGIKESPQ